LFGIDRYIGLRRIAVLGIRPWKSVPRYPKISDNLIGSIIRNIAWIGTISSRTTLAYYGLTIIIGIALGWLVLAAISGVVGIRTRIRLIVGIS